MSKSRKTIEVNSLIEDLNNNLARIDKQNTPDYRRGIIDAIERILHNSGNYKGFGYLQGWQKADEKYGAFDETRRFYY